MLDYKKMKVEEIRELLVTKHNLDRDTVNGLVGKTALVDKLKELEGDGDFVDNSEPTPALDLTNVKESTVEEVPDYNSYEWHDYVMKHFHENELVEGNPNIPGLRRVAGLLLGKIILSIPVGIFPSTESLSIGRATVSWHLEILFYDGTIRKFGGVADAYADNIAEDKFKIFPAAMAEVRAEARAFKRALNIRCVAAEELADKDPTRLQEALDRSKPTSSLIAQPNYDDNDFIPLTIKNFIISKCSVLKIDPMKFINAGSGKYASLDEIPKGVGSKMVERLNQYLKDVQNQSESIAASLEALR